MPSPKYFVLIYKNIVQVSKAALAIGKMFDDDDDDDDAKQFWFCGAPVPMIATHDNHHNKFTAIIRHYAING